jgi:dUTP pyrophosphatase
MNAKILTPPTVKTPEEAKDLAKTMAQKALEKEASSNRSFQTAFNEIKNTNLNNEDSNEIAVLLNLPEEAFALLAPAFMEEAHKSFNDVNNQMIMVKAMNLAGVKTEDLEAEYRALCSALDNEMRETLSQQKIDFLKEFIGISYNAVLQAEGIAKRQVLIPISFCRENAQMPTYAHPSDAGMDIYALEDITIAPGQTVLVPTGLKCALPLGYELQVRPKSGRCLKTKLRVANTPGTIDAGYRDEIGVIIDNIEPFVKSAEIDENGRLYNVEFGSSYTIGKGEKFAQLVLCEVPKAVFYEVESVAGIGEDRQGGFGSTGVK